MTAVSVTYILMAPEGFKLSGGIAYPIGIISAVLLFILYIYYFIKFTNKEKNIDMIRNISNTGI